MATNIPNTLRLGTRGSFLARTQSGMIADELMRRHRGLQVDLVIYKTSGDRITEGALHDAGGKGLFTKELENALLANEIDFAVHSFKDVPVTMPLVSQENLIVAAVPPREDARDVLVSRYGSLGGLPMGAKVGTGSLRRMCQLKHARPDLDLIPMRGNIDTRLRKAYEGEFDAVVLAMAGLLRAGLYRADAMSPLEFDECLPAAAQGALAVQCRRNDEPARHALNVLHDPTTAMCVNAERAIVEGLNGDCKSPIAALAIVEENTLTLRAAVGAHGGMPPVIRAHASGDIANPAAVVAQALKGLKEQGADRLLAVPIVAGGKT